MVHLRSILQVFAHWPYKDCAPASLQRGQRFIPGNGIEVGGESALTALITRWQKGCIKDPFPQLYGASQTDGATLTASSRFQVNPAGTP